MRHTYADPRHGNRMMPGGHAQAIMFKGNTHEDGNQQGVVHVHGEA